MFDTGITALKWLVGKLLDERKAEKGIKKEKWDNVANYFEELSLSIEEAVKGFRQDRPAYYCYSQLEEMMMHFDGIVDQICYKSDSEHEELRNRMFEAMNYVLHLYKVGDEGVPEIVALLDAGYKSPKGYSYIVETRMYKESNNDPEVVKSKVLGELEMAAGKFHAVAVSIRALS